jgi:hypothetical protein
MSPGGCENDSGTVDYHATKPPDGFSQLEDPALSIEQLQVRGKRTGEGVPGVTAVPGLRVGDV